MSPLSLTFAIVGLLCSAWLFGRPRPLDPGGDHRRVARTSIVIPARDEARSLPHLLTSLAASGAAPLEVIVVDDGSTDGTAELAAAAGATVVTAPPPPAGWVGKTWACSRGAEVASGDTLVFLDADTRLAPAALARLVGTHARHPDGLLSVQPGHDVPTAVEQLSAIPNLVSLLASGAFAPRADSTTTVAYGPCLVTSAAAYAAVGGHGAVAGEVIEDLHLARAYRASGRPVHARLGGDVVRFRMYPDGARSLVEGWTKNLAGGARLAPLGPTLGAVAWVATGAAITTALVAAGLGGDRRATLLAAGAYAAFAVQLGPMLRRIGSFRPVTSLAFPIPLVAFLGLFARSLWARSVRRSVRWRGREVAVGRG